MANPHTPGTEKFKLYAYALAKGNGDKGAAIFVEQMAGRGLLDVSGGTAVARTNLPVGGGASAGVSGTR